MKIMLKKMGMAILACLAYSNLQSQQLVNLISHWTAEKIIIDNGTPSLSKTTTNGWVIEKTTEEKYVRIKNSVTGTYLHTQNGHLEAGQISMGWYSAEWTLVPVGAYMQIVNRWGKTYINNEHGKLEATALGKPGWLSAQWILAPTTATLTVTGDGGKASTDNSVGGKLVGTWLAYDDIGRAYVNPAKIFYNGATLMIDNGQGSQSTLLASPGLIKAESWGAVGTIFSDATFIDWANGKNAEGLTLIEIGTGQNSIWIKNNGGQMKPGDVPATTVIPNLTGYWIAYGKNNVQEQGLVYISQHLYKIKYKNASGKYGVADLDVQKDGTILQTSLNATLGITVSQGAVLSADGKKITWNDGRYWVKD